MNYVLGFAFMVALIIGVFGKEWYSYFDHWEWEDDDRLDKNAEIVSVTSDKVLYVKNGGKYKTTVTFSDGFVYITHTTNREDGFFHYRISVDEELKKEIIKEAISCHNKTVDKILRKMEKKHCK